MTACLDCGRPGNKGSRCPACKAARAAGRSGAYDWEYEKAAKEAKRRAGTHCPRCNEPYTADNPPTGGHMVPVREGGTTADGVEAQCRRCNYGWRRTGL